MGKRTLEIDMNFHERHRTTYWYNRESWDKAVSAGFCPCCKRDLCRRCGRCSTCGYSQVGFCRGHGLFRSR